MTKIIKFAYYLRNTFFGQKRVEAGTKIYAVFIMKTKIFLTIVSVVFTITADAQWKAVNAGLTNLHVNVLAVSGTNIFAGTNNGVFFFDTIADHWNAVNTGLTNLNISSLVINGSNIFAGTGNGVYLSANSGINWTSVNNGLTNLTINSLAVGGTGIFAGTNNGLFLSTNDGKTWTPVESIFINLFVNSFTVCGSNIFAGTSSVFLSTDNGNSWDAMSTGLPHLAVTSLAICGNNMFAATDSIGIFIRPMAEMLPLSGTDNKTKDCPLVTIYPNPFISNAIIEIKRCFIQQSGDSNIGEGLRGQIDLVIYNLLGQDVINMKNILEFEQKITIDRGNLPNGIYFYELSENNKPIASGKLIAE